MLIVGYKSNVDFKMVSSALQRHTNLDKKSIDKIISDIKEGSGVTLPSDFVLFEDLKEANLLVS